MSTILEKRPYYNLLNNNSLFWDFAKKGKEIKAFLCVELFDKEKNKKVNFYLEEFEIDIALMIEKDLKIKNRVYDFMMEMKKYIQDFHYGRSDRKMEIKSANQLKLKKLLKIDYDNPKYQKY